MKISPARIAAFEALRRIESERAFSSVVLPLVEENLSPNDRGLCHELVLGVLRRQIYLDRMIESFTGGKKVDRAVQHALLLGSYQLLFLDRIPAYSAINESVNLVQRAKKTSAKGFVNAILRRIAETSPPLEFSDDVERVSVETSHPRWLIEKWIAEFGAIVAEEIARANNSIPRIAFRVSRKGRGKAFDLPASNIAGSAYVADAMSPELLAMADAGEIYFQDEASQLVAEVASSEPYLRFLDVCAAPGGKTSQIAANLADDSLVIAGDLHMSRLNQVRLTCAKQGIDDVLCVQYDAEIALPFADGFFDTVLVDAPCSGTGTIRHNPEIRYFLESDDFSELANKQRRILGNASKLVRPGGRLVYSTCSIEREENEGVCGNFLIEAAEFELRRPAIPESLLTSDGFGRTFPHRDGTDGFFIAEFRRLN